MVNRLHHRPKGQSRRYLAQAVDRVFANENIPDAVLDQLSLRELNRIAQARVEIAFERADDPFEQAFAKLELERRLNILGRQQIALGFGVRTFENALLAKDALFPGRTVGEVLATTLDVSVSQATPGGSDFLPEIARGGLLSIRRVAQDRVPF